MKKLSALLLAGVVASTVLAANSFAADDSETLSSSTAAENTTTEAGPFTSSHPVASHIITSPFRLVTGATAGTMGLIGGTFKGIGTGVQDSFGYANDFGPKGEDTMSRGAHGALYLPTATVGTVYYVPKNIATNAGKTSWDFANRGYSWWNRF